MKKFAVQVSATIVAILLLIGLFFIGFIFIVVVSQPSKPKLQDNVVLEIKLDKPIIESSSEKDLSISSLFNKDEELYLKDILDIIEQAKNDERIKGISLKLSDISSGYTELSEIRKKLESFKKKDKFIYAYSNIASQKAYYLSSVADSIFLSPEGGVEFAGLATEVLFFKNAGDKYGVDFEVIRHGNYKSAVEPYIRDNLSEENNLQLTGLLKGIWAEILEDISVSRKISQTDLNAIADNLYGFSADSTLHYKLVDKLVYESAYDNIIKKRLGVDSDDASLKISLQNYKEHLKVKKSDNKIALLYASGQIYSGKGTGAVYSEDFIRQIKKIKDDDKVKAVVLRINSPGGSANASAEIYYELMELKKKKPIIVSFGNMAASGGYYIAMASDRIFAQENTITGSIGVLSMIPNVKKLANNLGVTSDYVTTNSNSLPYSPMQGISPGMKTAMHKSIEYIYKKFVGVVMIGRKMTFEQADALGGGRVWTGKQAVENKLADELGVLDDAIQYAAKKSNITEYSIESYPKKSTTIDLILEQFYEGDDRIESKVAEKILKQELGEDKYKIYQKIKKLDNRGMMYIMPFELDIN